MCKFPSMCIYITHVVKVEGEEEEKTAGANR